MPNPKYKAIHRNDALHLLEDGEPHKLKVWKLTTGDILEYPDAIFIGKHTVRGVHRVRLKNSGQIRAFRDCLLFEVDDLSVYF